MITQNVCRESCCYTTTPCCLLVLCLQSVICTVSVCWKLGVVRGRSHSLQEEIVAAIVLHSSAKQCFVYNQSYTESVYIEVLEQISKDHISKVKGCCRQPKASAYLLMILSGRNVQRSSRVPMSLPLSDVGTRTESAAHVLGESKSTMQCAPTRPVHHAGSCGTIDCTTERVFESK